MNLMGVVGWAGIFGALSVTVVSVNTKAPIEKFNVCSAAEYHQLDFMLGN